MSAFWQNTQHRVHQEKKIVPEPLRRRALQDIVAHLEARASWHHPAGGLRSHEAEMFKSIGT
jgi:hypothetical protein